MTTLITLTLAGSDTGPFNVYSNIDNYTTAYATGLTRDQLLAGYNVTLPQWSTEVLVRSTGACQRDMYLNISGAPTTTTSTTPPPTTSSTTTPARGNITISYSTFSVAFNIYSDVNVPQSIYITAGISITGYSDNSCVTSVAAKTLTGGLLGLDVGGTVNSHAPTGSSGTWGSSTPYRFDGTTIPLSIGGGPTTSYANNSTVTISGILFTIHISSTCV